LTDVGFYPDIHTADASQITLSTFVLHRNIRAVLGEKRALLTDVGFYPDIHTPAASQITLSTFVLHRNIWTVLRRKKSAFSCAPPHFGAKLQSLAIDLPCSRRMDIRTQNCSRSLSICLQLTYGYLWDKMPSASIDLTATDIWRSMGSLPKSFSLCHSERTLSF